MSSRPAILVMSCDRFQPVWPLFYALLKKYWPDFDGNIYHYSETQKPDVPGVIALQKDFGQSAGNWSQGLLYALGNIEETYVILMLEDFLLNRRVNQNRIKTYLELMRSRPEIKCLRLVPVPPAGAEEQLQAGKITIGSPYRISTQIAIWQKDYLQAIARPGESPWQFEMDGTLRSAGVPGEVWAVTAAPPGQRVMTHVNGLIRGKLTRQARRFLAGEGLTPHPSIPVNSRLEEWYWFGAPGPVRKALDYINHNLYPILWRNKL